MYAIRAVPIRIPNRKQKQRKLSGVFSFIPNHFLQNRNRNRFVPVTFESVTICDIRDQNVTKSVLLKKKNGTNSHALSVDWVSIECDWYKPWFCFLFGIWIGRALPHHTSAASNLSKTHLTHHTSKSSHLRLITPPTHLCLITPPTHLTPLIHLCLITPPTHHSSNSSNSSNSSLPHHTRENWSHGRPWQDWV